MSWCSNSFGNSSPFVLSLLDFLSYPLFPDHDMANEVTFIADINSMQRRCIPLVCQHHAVMRHTARDLY